MPTKFIVPLDMSNEEAIQAVATDQTQVHQQVDALANNMAQLRQELHQAHQVELQKLRREILAAQDLALQAPHAHSPSLPSQNRLEPKDPETFTGKTEKANVRQFVVACRTRLASPLYRSASEFDKMLWVSSLLGEAASLWQQSKAVFHQEGIDFGFISADEMLAELELAFQVGDEQLEATQRLERLYQGTKAAQTLKRLRQGTKAAAQHIAEFEIIIAPLNMPEESKILSLRQTINEEIKDVLAMTTNTTKTDFAVFCRQVVAGDNRLVERAFEKGGKHYYVSSCARPARNYLRTPTIIKS